LCLSSLPASPSRQPCRYREHILYENTFDVRCREHILYERTDVSLLPCASPPSSRLLQGNLVEHILNENENVFSCRMCSLSHTKPEGRLYENENVFSYRMCSIYPHSSFGHVARLAGAPRGTPGGRKGGAKQSTCRYREHIRQGAGGRQAIHLSVPITQSSRSCETARRPQIEHMRICSHVECVLYLRRRAVHVRRVGPARGTCASHLCPSEDSGSQTDLLTPWYDRQAEIEHMRICSHVECVLYLRRAGRDRPFPVSADSRKVYSKQTQRTREHIENTFYMVAERDACA